MEHNITSNDVVGMSFWNLRHHYSFWMACTGLQDNIISRGHVYVYERTKWMYEVTQTRKSLYVIWTQPYYSVSDLPPCVWSVFTGRCRQLWFILSVSVHLRDGVSYRPWGNRIRLHSQWPFTAHTLLMLSFIIQVPRERWHAFSPSFCHSRFLSFQSLVPLQSRLFWFETKQHVRFPPFLHLTDKTTATEMYIYIYK